MAQEVSETSWSIISIPELLLARYCSVDRPNTFRYQAIRNYPRSSPANNQAVPLPAQCPIHGYDEEQSRCRSMDRQQPDTFACYEYEQRVDYYIPWRRLFSGSESHTTSEQWWIAEHHSRCLPEAFDGCVGVCGIYYRVETQREDISSLIYQSVR